MSTPTEFVSAFESAMLRLKERVGISSDKGIAELLGMTDKALNARKRRDAFPEDKLFALAAKAPELGLDVPYILTGQMHPEQIKAALRMKGVTPAALADELGVKQSTMSQVISGRAESARIKSGISRVLNIPVASLWPPTDRPRLRRTREEMQKSRATA